MTSCPREKKRALKVTPSTVALVTYVLLLLLDNALQVFTVSLKPLFHCFPLQILGMIVEQGLPVRVGLVLVSAKDVDGFDDDVDGDHALEVDGGDGDADAPPEVTNEDLTCCLFVCFVFTVLFFFFGCPFCFCPEGVFFSFRDCFFRNFRYFLVYVYYCPVFFVSIFLVVCVSFCV